MASVSWDYPKDRMLALQRQSQAAQTAAPLDTGLALEKIRFRYAISGSNPPWKPQRAFDDGEKVRSGEHTSELQSLMRISYAVFCLKKKKHNKHPMLITPIQNRPRPTNTQPSAHHTMKADT